MSKTSKGKEAAKSFKGTHAPYNFVPLPKRFIPPGWRKKTSIDVPLEHGVCGEMDIELVTQSPLMVGGERKPGDTVPFFNIDGLPVIPGSSMRGMIRNLAEIVSFGKLPEINNQYPTLRDVRDSAYKNVLTGAGNKLIVQAGWLHFSAEYNQYLVKPCDYARITYRDIETICGCPPLKNEKKVSGKYKKAGGLGREIDFALSGRNAVGEQLAKPGRGQRGRLVLTGWAYNKRKEYVFFNDKADEAVPPDVMKAFNHIYRQQGPKSMYAELDMLLKSNIAGAPGIPIFFTRNKGGEIQYLGLTLMMKIPPTYSVDDLHPRHKFSEHVPVDIVQNLFGHIDETPKDEVEQQHLEFHYSLKSRLSFADLKADDSAREVDDEVTVVLGQPSASFYPNYLVQSVDSSEGRLSDRMVSYHDEQKPQLRGFKRYPIQKGAPEQPPMPNLERSLAELQEVSTTMKPLAAGARFRGKIRFHNITPKELGLLLWCLTWGGQETLSHNMGMAKPYGYGQLKIKVKKLELEPNNDPGNWRDVTQGISGYCEEFAGMMENAAKGLKYAEGWFNGPVMQELMAMARGVPFSEEHLQNLPLKHHALAKVNDSASNLVNGYALKAFSAWLKDGKKPS